MIKRGERAEAKTHNAMPCPNCGNTLTNINGMHKCTSCEYELMINEIDYSKCYSRSCMICGNNLVENELQICQRCKEKLSNLWKKENDKCSERGS